MVSGRHEDHDAATTSALGCDHMDRAELDDQFMALALTEARLAESHGDIPIGAVVVKEGEILASRHNERQVHNDPTAHAEMLAIRDAAQRLGSSRLDGATLYTTLEPCSMCAGAALLARLDRVVFAAADPKAGACASLYNLGADPRLNHEFEVTWRVRESEAAELLTEFFRQRR